MHIKWEKNDHFRESVSTKEVEAFRYSNNEFRALVKFLFLVYFLQGSCLPFGVYLKWFRFTVCLSIFRSLLEPDFLELRIKKKNYKNCNF